MKAAETSTLSLDGRSVALTRLGKVLYPEAHFTKAHLIDYYVRVAPWLLPHVHDRPVTLKRYPDGIHGPAYWDKDAPGFKPEWVETVPVPRHAGGPDINYIVIADRPTLAWTANIAAIELHPFLHRKPDISSPASVVFDLDPGAGADIFQCIEVAFLLRKTFDRLGLQSFPKVSGSKGLQLYLPLNTPASYAVTQPFAHAIARSVERERPDLAISVMPKAQRVGKVFIDWSQNADFKTTVGVYSLRAKRERPFASLPVTWDELESALRRKQSEPLYFEPRAALERLDRLGDLFAPVVTLRQTLPEGIAEMVPAQPARARKPAPAVQPQPRRSAQGGRRRFVVEKHGSGYELRLEIGRTAKSWTVPKSFPQIPGARKLIGSAEDLPLTALEKASPWDAGTYEPVEGSYKSGSFQIGLSGGKLRGEYLLTRESRGDGDVWTLEKSGAPPESAAPAPSGAAHPAARAEFIEPMQCKLEQKLPEGAAWEYEAKLDGYRALVLKQDGKAAILSRRNNSLTSDFPEVADAFRRLPDGTVIDGEIVALDASGKMSFNRLQNRRLNRAGIRYYAFDLLVHRGRRLTAEPLRRRRELLQQALDGIEDPVYLSAVLDAPPTRLMNLAREHDLEGIVAKRLDSIYEPGKRSGAWVKVKINLDQELVIGGYLPAPKRHFDALLAGYYRDGKLIFAGKVRNGFKAPGSKERLFERFRGLGASKCPFDNLPEPANARRGMALTAEAMQLCCWLKPELVAQVGIREWTSDGHLRHSTFLGLRKDKDPREVVRETA